jgi:A/G-specific adenine glycosylase
MTEDNLVKFQQTVLEYYQRQGRHDLPWRQPLPGGGFDPYRILVSELMLQQTQVPRVIPKFLLFTEAFPSFESLAVAPLADVLKMWSGLGYNRRAKFLLQTAQTVSSQHQGRLPGGHADLIALPGIGHNTAGAIRAYAFNDPVVFIETNIRTVFIHHFFTGQEKVRDSDLLPLIEASLANQDVRSWYWALMDYGTHIKQTVGNASKASASYSKQSKFEGSRRQIRGRVLRLLADNAMSAAQLGHVIQDDRLQGVIDDLVEEGFIARKGSVYELRA